MDGEKLESGRTSIGGPRFQFSLRTLLVFTGLAAVVLALLSSVPTWIAGPALFLLAAVLPAALTTLVIYGDGDLRAFSLGALFPAGIQFVTVYVYVFYYTLDLPKRTVYQSWSFDLYLGKLPEAEGLRHAAILTWTLSVLLGLVAVGIRRLVKKPHRDAGASS